MINRSDVEGGMDQRILVARVVNDGAVSGYSTHEETDRRVIVLVRCISRVRVLAFLVGLRLDRVSAGLTGWPPGEIGSVSPCGEAKKLSVPR